MKRSRFTEEQIIAALRDQDAGVPTAEVCRKHGVSSASFYKWKAKFGGPEVSEARRLKALERENGRLKTDDGHRRGGAAGNPKFAATLLASVRAAVTLAPSIGGARRYGRRLRPAGDAGQRQRQHDGGGAAAVANEIVAPPE